MERVIDLGPDCLLARTAEGTRKMSSRDTELAPRLRSALFLVSGQRTFRDLMDLAGGVAHVLETQIRALLDLGLIEVAGRPRLATDPPDLYAAAGAKIQLIKCLEAAGGVDSQQLASLLRDATTLRQLAERSRDIAIAIRLRDAAGQAAAENFWIRAKEILIQWRAILASGTSESVREASP